MMPRPAPTLPHGGASANGALGYLHLAWEWTIRGVLPCGGLLGVGVID